MKHYKLVEFYLFPNVKPPCTSVKSPYWRISGDGCLPRGLTLAPVITHVMLSPEQKCFF